jgi:arylsulfatase A-like enzyme
MLSTTPPQPPWLLGNAKMPALSDYKWKLYNIAEDFSQNNDLAEKMPDKLKEMQTLFLEEAAKFNVFPLDNTGENVGILIFRSRSAFVKRRRFS